MILSLAFVVTTAFQAGTLFSTWFPQPTGANGLEEYVRAADLISKPEFAAFLVWKPADGSDVNFPSFNARSRLRTLSEPTPGDISALQPQLRRGDFADLCTLEYQKYGKALELLHDGNDKPLQTGESEHAYGDFIFAVMPYLQSLSDLGLRGAYAMLSEGRTSQATQLLVDQLIFADKLARTGGTAQIMMREVTPHVTTLLQARLNQLSLTDCQTLDSFLNRLLSDRPALVDGYRTTEKFWMERIAQFVQKVPAKTPADAAKPPAGVIDDYALWDAIRPMSDGQRQALIANAQSAARSAFSQFYSRFDGPESGWLAPLPDNRMYQLAGITDADELPDKIAFKSKPGATMARLLFDVVQRERLRLLDIHTQIQAFQWKHFRLPRNLDELKVGISTDPLNGKQFEYKALSSGGYELSSLGTPETGPIRLVPEPLKRPTRDPNNP